jgi:hypothetical protein
MMTRLFQALAVFLLPACLCGQLKISEVSTTIPSWVEVINLGSSPVNMNGYRIRFGGNSGLSFIQGVYTFGATTLAPNQTFVITEDISNTFPTVPNPAFRAYCGSSIVWVTIFATGVNGVVSLNDPSDISLDRMKWGNPLQDFSVYGGTWTGTISPVAGSAPTMYRNSPTDTDGPADWTFTASPTPGAVNPGEANVLSMQILTTPGTGNITLNVTTLAPPVPFGDIFNLFSFIDSVPDGSGPLFGIGADALLQATQGFPFRTNLDANGNFQLSSGPGSLPIGLHVEGVSLLLQGTITRISTVAVVTF